MPVPPVLHVGYRNYVVSDRVQALVSADSAPMRRLIQSLRGTGQIIDATQGHKTKSLLFMANSSIVLSAVSQEVLAKRLAGEQNAGADD